MKFFLFIIILASVFFISFALLNTYVQAELNSLRCGVGIHCSAVDAIEALTN